MNASNLKTVAEKGKDSLSEAAGDIAEFGTKALEQGYQTRIEQLNNLIKQVKEYQAPPGPKPQTLNENNYTDFIAMPAADPLYPNIDLPMNGQEVVDMLENLGSEVRKSSFLAVLKAMVNFIRAMLTVDLWVNPDLKSSLKSSSYSSVGGLPSKKDRSAYPLTSPDSTDQQQSDYYKSLMGGYSANGLDTGRANGFIETVNALRSDMDAISEAWDEIKWYNVLFKLGTIAARIGSIGANLMKLVGQIVQVINTAVYEKVLLAGYLGYNTANRTTFSGKALTGASYDLPDKGAEGKCLYGAETECISLGNESETTNQTYPFFITYVLCVLVNIPVIALNGEVESIAAAAGAATFGVGSFIVYAVYVLAEPLVDTLILMNGGDIPVIKTIAYLTPSGLSDMVEAVTSLKMTEAQTNKARALLSNVMSGQGLEAEFGKSYADAMDAFGDGSDTTLGKINSLFEMNYTHTLIIIMLFIDSEAMVKRLGDIYRWRPRTMAPAALIWTRASCICGPPATSAPTNLSSCRTRTGSPPHGWYYREY